MFRAVVASEHDFDSWREAARPLALARIPADQVVWQLPGDPPDMFAADPPAPPADAPGFAVPRSFVDLARAAIRHEAPERFAILYALLLKTLDNRAAPLDREDPLVTRAEMLAGEIQQRALAMVNDRPAAWDALRTEAMSCRRCSLYRNATATVFGEGPVDTPLMMVGEQPGDQEDIQGRPFVGPAGQLLDKAIQRAGMDRARVYISNAVKHFKFVSRGPRRIHAKPDSGEIAACRWWIDQERMLIRPRVVVALGVTAAQSLLGRTVTISRTRGTPIALADGSECHVTVHPSFLLRIEEEDRKREEWRRFIEDLARARQAAGL